MRTFELETSSRAPIRVIEQGRGRAVVLVHGGSSPAAGEPPPVAVTEPLGGDRLTPEPLRARLRALAGMLPDVRDVVTMRARGHGAHYSAPGTVAGIAADFADRTAR